MDTKAGIILEGGAMRSVFSAGILDFFLDKGIEIPNVLAISAGAYAGMNYVSGQRGRIVDSVIQPMTEEKCVSFRNYLTKGTFFDMDLLFDEIPRRRAPFDFDSFFASEKRFITSTINCNTGETLFFEKFKDSEDFLQVCRAANSMPLLAKVARYNDIPMLDGGMGEAIPIQKALEEGWKKIIVILTRDEKYRKRKRHFYLQVLRLIYHKYPAFLKLVENRSERYNKSLETIMELEKEGHAYIFRPTEITIHNNETNVDRLMKYYQHGYDTAKEQCSKFEAFLKGTA